MSKDPLDTRPVSIPFVVPSGAKSKAKEKDDHNAIANAKPPQKKGKYGHYLTHSSVSKFSPPLKKRQGGIIQINPRIFQQTRHWDPKQRCK